MGKVTKEKPEIRYVCKYCKNTYDTREEFAKECGSTWLTKDDFEPGDLVRRNGARVWMIRYIDDGCYVTVERPDDYITAFGFDKKHYGGPWAIPAERYCKRSLTKLPIDDVRQQFKLRKKQLKAAERLLQKMELSGGSDSNASPAPRRARSKRR